MESFGAEASWSLLNAAPDGVVVTSEAGEIVFVSDQAATLLGYEPTDLTGQSVDVLLPEAVRSIHRAHRTRYRAEPTPRAMGAGLLLRARRSDGSEFPVEISLKPLRREGHLFVVAAVRDVSDRVATEEHLRRVLLTLDASDDGVFIFDAVSLRYSYVNDGAVRLVGYHRDELLAMTPLHLNPDDSEQEYRAFIESLESSPHQARMRQARMLRKDGSDVPVEKTYRLTPTGDGGSRWIIALARDISARLTAEAELQLSQEALQRGGACGRHRRRPRAHRPRSARQGHPTAVRVGAQPPSDRRRDRRSDPTANRVDDRLVGRHHPRAPHGDLLPAGLRQRTRRAARANPRRGERRGHRARIRAPAPVRRAGGVDRRRHRRPARPDVARGTVERRPPRRREFGPDPSFRPRTLSRSRSSTTAWD